MTISRRQFELAALAAALASPLGKAERAAKREVGRLAEIQTPPPERRIYEWLQAYL